MMTDHGHHCRLLHGAVTESSCRAPSTDPGALAANQERASRRPRGGAAAAAGAARPASWQPRLSPGSPPRSKGTPCLARHFFWQASGFEVISEFLFMIPILPSSDRARGGGPAFLGFPGASFLSGHLFGRGARFSCLGLAFRGIARGFVTCLAGGCPQGQSRSSTHSLPPEILNLSFTSFYGGILLNH